MINDYSSLVSSVKSYLQRTDQTFEHMIPTFIQLAQQRITKDLKILSNQSVYERNIDNSFGDSYFLEKPRDWLSTISLFVSNMGNVTPLEIRTFQFMNMYGGKTIVPIFFCEQDQEKIIVNKYSSKSVTLILNYYSVIEPLSEYAPTNVLIERLPQLFLYATLLETASYLREDERLETWTKYYGFMKEAVNLEDVQRIQLAKTNTH